MIVDRPVPFAEAIAALQSKGLMPTDLSSAQLEQLSAELRERAFFSARVNNAEILSQLYERINTIISPENRTAGEYMNPARFRVEIREVLQQLGYTPDPDDIGTIKDLRTDARMNLIARMNADSVRSYGQYVQAQEPAALDAFPAQELFRLETRMEPRDWISIWRGAGGRFFGGGRMIALLNDPLWSRISRFGTPYPPFDYNSGMWVRPVSREEAEQFGLLAPAQPVQPQRTPLNQSLQAGVRTMPQPIQDGLQQSMGGLANIAQGVLSLVGAANLIQGAIP
jgi:hypothetical protein